MPNHYSALKRTRQTKRRTTVNRKNKGIFRATLRNGRNTLTSEPREKAAPVVTLTLSSIDKAVQKGLIHKNTASRLKSRFMARANAMA